MVVNTPGLGRLLDLINTSNLVETALTVDNVEVVSVSEDTSGSGRNTVTVLKGIEGGPYKGQVSVYYNRVDMGLMVEPSTTYSTNKTNQQFITSDLNTRYEAFLADSDYEVTPEIPADDSNGDAVLSLAATVDSVAWRGQTQYTIVARPLLTEAFSSLIFNGI